MCTVHVTLNVNSTFHCLCTSKVPACIQPLPKTICIRASLLTSTLPFFCSAAHTLASEWFKYASTVFILHDPHPRLRLHSLQGSSFSPPRPPEEISVSSMKYNLTLTLPHSLSHSLYLPSHQHLM